MRITSILSSSRKYDLVIFGASGFTGKHVVEYLIERLKCKSSIFRPYVNPDDIKWAVAGRDASRIVQVNHEIFRSNRIDIIEADVNNMASLRNMTSRTRLLLNCVGPYATYGDPVVKSCLDTSTHYLDVSGEPYFLETIQSKYHEDCIRRKTLMIGSCGFDSVPADMGVDHVTSIFGYQNIESIETYLMTKSSNGRIRGNFPTWASLVTGYRNYEKLKDVRNRFFRHDLLTVDPRVKDFFKHDSMSRKVFQIKNGKYILPFPGSDRSVIKRSQFFKFTQSQDYDVYSTPLIPIQTYYEFPSLIDLISCIFAVLSVSLLKSSDFGIKLLMDYSKIFSGGIFDRNVNPSKEDLAGCSFDMRIVAKLKNGLEKSLAITGPGILLLIVT